MNKNGLQQLSAVFLLSFLLFFSGCGSSDTTGNKLPVADAGGINGVITVEQNDFFTFDASKSYDVDGTITNYEWFCPGLNFTLYSGSNNTLTMPAARDVGDYNTTLIITDDKNATATDYVIVRILAPTFVVDAGADQNVTENEFYTLNANKSFYTKGNIVSYEWLYADNNVSIYKGSDSNLTLQADREVGYYNIQLIVTNDKNETAKDSVIVRIGDAPFVDVFGTSITVDQFKTLQEQSTIYIDVRTDGELHNSGIIEGSYTIVNPANINTWLQEGSKFLDLVTTPNQSFTIICSTGSRASGVANALLDKGYTKVHFLGVGTDGWRSSGGLFIPYEN